MSTDYNYNQTDCHQVRSALLSLKEAEQTGFYYGVFTGLVSYVSLQKFTRLRGNYLKGSTLFASVLAYNLSQQQARINYGKVAEIANKNASIELNKMMNY